MLKSSPFKILIIIFSAIFSGLSHNAENNLETSIVCNLERKLSIQPIRSNQSKVKKCCRNDENLYSINDTMIYHCNRRIYPIIVSITTVELFDDCIGFQNSSVVDDFPIESIGNPKNHRFFQCTYFGPIFGAYIIQNGSLMITNTFGHFSYKLYDDYCLDTCARTAADVVCFNVEPEPTINPPPPHKFHLYRSVLSRIFTLLSIPFFVGVALLHLYQKTYRNLHGLCIASISIFMAVEFVLQSILDFSNADDNETLWRTILYFGFIHYLWMLVIFTNSMLFVWIYLPYNLLEWKPFGICSYLLFFIFSVSVPKMISNQMNDDELKTIIEFLTTPKTTIVFICILLLMVTFMGSIRLTTAVKKAIFQGYYVGSTNDDDSIILQYHIQIEEVENRLICLTSLAGLLVILRVFCLPGHFFTIYIREALNSLQGVFFYLIFIVLRKYGIGRVPSLLRSK